MHSLGLPSWLSGIKSNANAGDLCSIPRLGSSLEEEMATHSSFLAWEIPWTEEPGRLQSMGQQRAGHDLETKQHYAFIILLESLSCVW